MKRGFFERNRTELCFEWNKAAHADWVKIRRNFVAAYLCAYEDRSFEELMFGLDLQQGVEKIWNTCYENSLDKGFESLFKQIIQPLQFYMDHKKEPLKNELTDLKKHFIDKTHDICAVRLKMIKLIMLKNYFEKELCEEMMKLGSSKNIDYLVTRYHEQPIAFFVCELNYKTAHVYLRFVTIEPAFHRLGLGKMILEQISKYYPEANGMQLYTRKANHSAQSFYKECGFQEHAFNFGKPTFMSNQTSSLCLPENDATDYPKAFVAFNKDMFHIQYKL